jgi:hypothetical protein
MLVVWLKWLDYFFFGSYEIFGWQLLVNINQEIQFDVYLNIGSLQMQVVNLYAYLRIFFLKNISELLAVRHRAPSHC